MVKKEFAQITKFARDQKYSFFGEDQGYARGFSNDMLDTGN